jgi:hypothetical protein
MPVPDAQAGGQAGSIKPFHPTQADPAIPSPPSHHRYPEPEMHIRLVLATLVIMLATMPAFALESCFTESTGSWRGPVQNSGELQTMDTAFTQDADGALIGHYHVYDTIPFDGTLAAFHQTGDCEADFVWQDRFGTGTVHIRFEPFLGRFLGFWGDTVPTPGRLFNGYRTGPNVTS